jgi:hypothetical protein
MINLSNGTARGSTRLQEDVTATLTGVDAAREISDTAIAVPYVKKVCGLEMCQSSKKRMHCIIGLHDRASFKWR